MTPEQTADTQPTAAAKKSRPFPWLCPRCLQKKVNMAVIVYQAERRRGDQLVSVEIPDLRVPKCEHCGELLITYEVDDQIRGALDAAERPISQQQPTAMPGAGSG